MRVLGILFLFLNLVGSLLFWSDSSSKSWGSTIQLPSEPASDLSIQQGSTLELGEALPITFIPERPVVRAAQYFFNSQFILNTISGLSAICEIQGINYRKLALAHETNLPAFLIVFPHHNFT